MSKLFTRATMLGAIAGAAFALTSVPASADEIVITLAHHYPKNHIQGKGYELWAKLVNERGKGKVKVISHPAASLINARESLAAVSKGSVQASNMLGLFQIGTLPFINSISLPFLFEDRAHFKRALDAGLFDFIEKQYEKQNIKLLNYFSKGATFVFHNKKFLVTPADYKGTNLRALGGIMTKMLEQFGSNAVTLPTSEVTTALQRGVVDGLMTSCAAYIARGWSEYAPYISDVDLAESGEGLGMNLEFYNSLPDDVKKIVNDAAKEMEKLEWDLTVQADQVDCQRQAKEMKLHYRKETPAERAELRKAAHVLYADAEKNIPYEKEVRAFVESTRASN